MSTEYPILDNRPIDQWRVTELREELRRRRLTTKGLKEELVRRLDEELHSEIEFAKEEELGNGFDPDSVPKAKVNDKGAEPVPEDNTEPVEDKGEKVDSDAAMVDINDSTLDVNQGIKDQEGIKDQDGNATCGSSLDEATEDTAINAVPMENSVTDSQNVIVQFESSDQDSRCDKKNEDLKPPAEDVTPTMTKPNNQVSEVSPDLGFQVKCESISTDSVSINEKNELKDNLNAYNFHLELEVEPEMVQPSSSNVPTIGGDLHPLDDDQDLVDNQDSLEDVDDVTCAPDVELSQKNDSADGGSPEKLNLDKSSGDESMEEDVLESKQIESMNDSDVAGERGEISKVHVVQVGDPIDSGVGALSPKKGAVVEEETRPAAPIEKRKAEDQEAVGVNEPKRQCRWNSENIKVPELQTSKLISNAPKDVFQPTPKRSLTRSDSSLCEDAPKERIVPPSQKAAMTSLRIDRFLRPFTLKAVQELLAKTGTFSDFWMDHIKTHCYVTYSSVEEAIATRAAVYNLQWPPNGGRLLVAEFVDPQEVKARVEAPQSPAVVTPSPRTPTTSPFQQQLQAPPPPRHHHALRQQQLPPPPPLPPLPALSNPPPVKEQLPPPPPIPKKPDPPIVTLDDLFKKTRATPRIYYLPLSEEQVAAKIAAQGKRAREQ